MDSTNVQRPPDIIAAFDVGRLMQETSQSGIIVFGAGVIGKVTLAALRQYGVSRITLCDNDENKQSTQLDGFVIAPPEHLRALPAQTPVLVAAVYLYPIMKQLQAMGFTRFYACSPLIEAAKDTASVLSTLSFAEQRSVALYAFSLRSLTNPESLNIKSLDVVLTEKCTLKCHDCANLMQYYVKPVNCDHSVIVSSIRRFMSCVDHLFEFRLLGGEPFIDKQIGDIIDELLRYENLSYIIIYTNGTLIPSAATLQALKNPRIQVQVTDYGPLSRNIKSVLALFCQHAINYSVTTFDKWQDCGDIEPRNRSTKELEEVYDKCCAADIYTLLHGTLYPCPFAAHVINLGAIPPQSAPQVHLGDDAVSEGGLRARIKAFVAPVPYHLSCMFCGGRDFGHATIPAAIQSPAPRPYKTIRDFPPANP